MKVQSYKAPIFEANHDYWKKSLYKEIERQRYIIEDFTKEDPDSLISWETGVDTPRQHEATKRVLIEFFKYYEHAKLERKTLVYPNEKRFYYTYIMGTHRFHKALMRNCLAAAIRDLEDILLWYPCLQRRVWTALMYSWNEWKKKYPNELSGI